MSGFIDEWFSMGVTAVLWTHCLLSVDYNTATKTIIDFSADTVLYECRNLSNSGYFVMYHNVEDEFCRPSARHGRYVVMPIFWCKREVPQGFWAGLAPHLVYFWLTIIANAYSASGFVR